MPGSQQEPNMKDGKRIKVSPGATAEHYGRLKGEEARESLRGHQARFKVATEHLATAFEEVKSWKEQNQLAEQQRETQEHRVKVLSQLSMGRDGGFRQDQFRKRERSRESLRFRAGDFLSHLRTSRFSENKLAG